MNILISACLLGVNCRYDGRGFRNIKILKLSEKYNLIPVCSEQLGGLATPRTPVEIKNGKAIDKYGIDVTKNFKNGALEVLRLAKLFNCKYAVLKSRSPSCGYKTIYDGTFTGKLTEGSGFAAKALSEAGITILNEDNYSEVLQNT